MEKFPLLFLCLINFLLVDSIRYSITTNDDEIVFYDEDIIKNKEIQVRKLMIDDGFHVLDNDMLEITERVEVFIMDRNYPLHEIASGAFADQEITETILIIHSQVEVIKNGTFKNLKIFELILKENEITHIEEEAIVNLPNLRTVNLSGNKMMKISGNSFVDAPVRFLDLAFNRFKEVGGKWFSFMSGGEESIILLDNNRIEKIDGEAFEGVVVGTLNLRTNNLEEIPPEIFEKNAISRIYLQNNKLKSLPESFFKLTHLTVANVKGNLFDCPTRDKLKKLAGDVEAIVTFDDDC